MFRNCLAVVLFCYGCVAMGCATIMNGGTTQRVFISSEPAGAEVEIKAASMTVNTPAYVDLKRREAHTLEISKDGFAPASAQLSSGMSAWVLGNVLLGGIIGVAIDFVGGGGYTLSPEKVHFTMAPAPAIASSASASASSVNPELAGDSAAAD